MLSNAGNEGLAGLISALENDVTPSRSSARGIFAMNLASGMNAALNLEHIANPAFIAGAYSTQAARFLPLTAQSF